MSGPEMMIARAAFSAFQAVEAGRAADADAKASARVAERDASIAATRGAARAAEERRRGAARLASQRARLAHGGVDAAGTARDLLAQISADTAFNALRQADGGNVTAVNRLTRAQMLRRRGAAARRAGVSRAGASLLGGLR